MRCLTDRLMKGHWTRSMLLSHLRFCGIIPSLCLSPRLRLQSGWDIRGHSCRAFRMPLMDYTRYYLLRCGGNADVVECWIKPSPVAFELESALLRLSLHLFLNIITLPTFVHFSVLSSSQSKSKAIQSHVVYIFICLIRIVLVKWDERPIHMYKCAEIHGQCMRSRSIEQR